MLIVLLSFVALAIDVGYMVVVKNELQNVADAGALAGARQLGDIYEPMTSPSSRPMSALIRATINTAGDRCRPH